MESIGAYFAANPDKFTMFAIFVVIMIVYFILSRFIKLTIAVIAIVLVVGGVNLFKNPAPLPEKIKKTAETFIAGGKQLTGRFGDFWKDSKEVASEAKKLPGDINQLLDAPVDGGTKNKGDAKKK
jgi:hypothetical protein